MIKMLMMVGLGSFAGGILRFLLSRFVQVNSASSFPWGTAAVYLLGCFILGALYGLAWAIWPPGKKNMETRRCAWPAALFYRGTLEMEMDGQQNHAPPPLIPGVAQT